MLRSLLIAVGLFALVAAPAAAQSISSKKECARALADAREARASSDAGPKANKEADDLLEVADHLCSQGNFVYAANVLAAVRGILATEN